MSSNLKEKKISPLNQNLTKPKKQAFYGTAGYRLNTPDLNNVLCRASIIAYIRSATFAGKYIGLYITASHNPVEYNGIKFVDFNGNMLDESWENASNELVNCEDKDFDSIINKILRQNSNISNIQDAIKGQVIIGRDTRESGIDISKHIKEVLEKNYRCTVYDYGVVSCPEMHFLIRKSNEANKMVPKETYLNHLMKNFNELISLTSKNLEMGVDTANGVGQIKINEIKKLKSDCGLEILNKPEFNILNKDCGADYIKTTGKIPKLNEFRNASSVCASFDGDVDRLILFDQKGKIFDGDRQFVFLTDVIKSELINEGLLSYEIGVVLSYYSNSGAMDYLKQKGVTVVLSQTGVKNFVKESKKFDVGLFSEPNGHGSIYFSKRLIDKLEEKGSNSILKTMARMFDPCVGDAIANLLVFKALLKSTADLEPYRETISRLLIVKIKDKNLIKVDSTYRVIDSKIQKKIDEQVLTFKGRAFVRPSGTEDLVRVFAECQDRKDCDKMALNIAQMIYDNCDGQGPHPEISYLE
jgi:phosphoacetylglucosamine mutase